MKTHGPVPNRANAVFVNVNKAEIGGDARGKMESLPGANVVGNAFEALEKLKAQEAKKTNEKNYGKRDQTWDKFERFRLHDERKTIEALCRGNVKTEYRNLPRSFV
jgi:hypothetical protein